MLFEAKIGRRLLIMAMRDIEMPTYKFFNHQTNEEFVEFMTISERDKLLEENPHLEQLVHGFPGTADPTRLGLRKPDDNFRDVLKTIKSKHRRSTVNTW